MISPAFMVFARPSCPLALTMIFGPFIKTPRSLPGVPLLVIFTFPYSPGKVDPFNLGKEVSCLELSGEDTKLISSYLKEYCEYFGFDFDEVMGAKFTKMVPLSLRPYGNMYVY